MVFIFGFFTFSFQFFFGHVYFVPVSFPVFAVFVVAVEF